MFIPGQTMDTVFVSLQMNHSFLWNFPLSSSWLVGWATPQEQMLDHHPRVEHDAETTKDLEGQLISEWLPHYNGLVEGKPGKPSQKPSIFHVLSIKSI